MLEIRLSLCSLVLACLCLTACGDNGSSVITSNTSAVTGTVTANPTTPASTPSTSTPSTSTPSTSASSTSSTGTPATGTTSAPTSATAAWSVSGTVSGVTGVSVAAAGSTANTTTTDTSGNFNFATLAAGSYTITPKHTGFVFSPVSRVANVTTVSVTGLTFAGSASTAATYTISGSVTGSAVSGVVITLNGSNVGEVVTDLSGNYLFTGLVSGTYTLSASRAGYSFSAPLIVSIKNVDVNSKNFTSTSAAGNAVTLSAVNPLPQATVGSPYSGSVVKSVAGGKAPYTYASDTLSTGTPPLGMIVNPNGRLTGTAGSAGKHTFSVCATDSTGEHSACEPTSVTVVAATTTPTPTPSPVPTIALSASPTTIASGKSAVITWSSKNATACDASGAWTGTKADSGSATVAPTSSATYTLTCTGAGGSDHAAVLITVTAAPVAPPGAPAPTVSLSASEATITSGGSTTLKWSATAATSCTASGGWTGTEAISGTATESPSGSETYTLTCKGSGGSAAASTHVTVSPVQPPTTPPASGTSWVYYDGTFDWPGDYSYEAVPDYADTSGDPLSGSKDIKVTITSSWGGWLPYAQNWSFNSAGYTKLTFALKPTVANQKWEVFFVKVGDVPVGIYLDPSNYGPAPVVGQWATYSIPLSDLGVLGTTIYKFCIADQTGLSNNVWYVDNVGFAP